jgi:hypothetical protein
MTQAMPAQIALATLNHGAQLDAVLCETLRAAGAEIVYEASLQTLDFAALTASGARVVVVNLPLDQNAVARNGEAESNEDEAADAAIDQLHADGFDVVFNEVRNTAGDSVEQRARWVRHLVAKILHRPDFVLPPQPEGAPVIVSAPLAAVATKSAAAVVVVPEFIPAAAPASEPPVAHAGTAVSSWQAAQDALDQHRDDEVIVESVETQAPEPALSWLDAQAALESTTVEDEVAPPVEATSDTPALSWRDVQDALEIHTAEVHVAAPVATAEAVPAVSWQEAQDALDFKLFDADEADVQENPHASAPAEAPAEQGGAAAHPDAHELIDWDKGFQLVDLDSSERPTLELPLPADLRQAAGETLPEKTEAPITAVETNVSAPDWGLVPLVDDKPTSVDVEKEFEAKAMYIPDAANKKRHDFDLNDSNGRAAAESNKDKTS